MPQKTDVEQLSCPIADHYTTNAETQAGVAARMLEHFMDAHLPDDENTDPVISQVKVITGRFK